MAAPWATWACIKALLLPIFIKTNGINICKLEMKA